MFKVNTSRYWAHMVTLRCNSPCPYCLLHNRGKPAIGSELSGKEIVDFWNNVEHNPGQKLSLIGGEPTLHKDIEYILNNLENYSITLTTNLSSKFYKDPGFVGKFKVHPTSSLRINASFHDSGISADDFIKRVKIIKDNSIFLDSIIIVTLPCGNNVSEVNKIKAIHKVSASPFTGFYSQEDGFKASREPKNLYPNEKWGGPAAQNIGGYRNYNSYREICGSIDTKTVRCPNPPKVFMISPDGYIYGCHYNLYYGVDPIAHISDPKVETAPPICDHYGHCIGCDINRLKCTPLKEI